MAVPSRAVPLSSYTTLEVGGPAAVLVTAESTEELVTAVAAGDAAGEPVLLLGGGSNLVISDEGFPGTAVHIASSGVTRERGTDGTVRVRARAGEDWDAFVEYCVAADLSGIECLSGIPGRVGATPIQNVGAYGQEVSETIVEVVVYDRESGGFRTMGNAECGFTYRDSVFKGGDRFVVCEVVFELAHCALSRPIRYGELARALDTEVGERVPLRDARDAVLRLRRGKGMVIDPADPDSRSAGSFFTNPVLTQAEFTDFRKRVADRLGPGVEPPAFPLADGRVKTSAAWLIDHAGFTKGYRSGPARISTKHALALTNPGGATATDLLALAREVRRGVAEAFGITLANEPVIVGTRL